MLAYYFPPLAGIASERATALSRHLIALGWEVTVITSVDGFYHRSSEWESAQIPTVHTKSIELSRILRRAYTGTADDAIEPLQTGRFGERARRTARDVLYVPDAQVGWIPFAAAAAARLLRASPKPRLVYSSSVPYSAHLAARAAAHSSGASWVAELRDPWFTGSSSLLRSPSHTRRTLDAKLERSVLTSADHVITTTHSLRRELLAQRFGLRPEQVSVVTNGFEPIPERAVPPPAEPMTILYAGTVAVGETTAPTLEALDMFERRYPGRFKLRILGPEDPWRLPNVGGSERPWLELCGVVSPREAREAMAESSVLLLVRCHPTYRNVLPGKLFEYIGVRRPILAICPAETEMLELMERHADVRHVLPDERGPLLSALEQLLEDHATGRLQSPRVEISTVAPLRRSEQASQLAAILEAVARPSQ